MEGESPSMVSAGIVSWFPFVSYELSLITALIFRVSSSCRHAKGSRVIGTQFFLRDYREKEFSFEMKHKKEAICNSDW
jgi:hypothetical protein